jgi:hypothetical protein
MVSSVSSSVSSTVHFSTPPFESTATTMAACCATRTTWIERTVALWGVGPTTTAAQSVRSASSDVVSESMRSSSPCEWSKKDFTTSACTPSSDGMASESTKNR